MEYTLTRSNKNRGVRALFAVSAVLAAAFFALHIYERIVCREAKYGGSDPTTTVCWIIGFVLSAAVAFAGVRLLKTKHVITLSPFIAVFGLIVSVLPAIINSYSWYLHKRFLYIGDFSIYTPCFVMLTAFLAGLAGTYRTAWKWQSLPTTLVLLALPCIALVFPRVIPLIVVIFFTWFFFMIALSRGGRMQTPWYVLAGVSVLFIGLFSYSMLVNADGMERLSTIFTRGQSDPLGAGYVRTIADEVMRGARFFGPADERIMNAQYGELPLSLFVADFEYPFELIYVLAKSGWAAFIAIIALQFVIPVGLLLSSRRAPNGYAKYFAVFVGLYLLGKTGLGVFSLLFSDISAPLPFFDGITSTWMDLFLLFTAYTLLLYGETDLAETERVYDASASLVSHLRDRFWPSFDDILELDAEFELREENREAFYAFLKKIAVNREPAAGGAVYVSTDEEHTTAANALAETLRAAGTPCDCFAGNPIGTENEAQCMEALRKATVFVRLFNGVEPVADPWPESAERITALELTAMIVRLPSNKSEAAEAEAAEDVPEDVPQVPEIPGEAAGPRAVVWVHTGEAELVVFRLLVRIGQDAVGLIGLLEAGLRLLVPRMQVRVALLGHAAICFFDLVVRSPLLEPKDLIVIPFICHIRSLTFYARRGGTAFRVPPAAYAYCLDTQLLGSTSV